MHRPAEPQLPMVKTSPAGAPTGRIRIAPDLLKRAREHDELAIVTLFSRFIPSEEQIVEVEFLGSQGLWGLGPHSFACVTARRVSALKVGAVGQVSYQDAFLEEVQGMALHQPTGFMLFLGASVGTLSLGFMYAGWLEAAAPEPILALSGALLCLAATLLFFASWVRLYYRWVTSGLVVKTSGGARIIIPASRRLVGRVTTIQRQLSILRDVRRATMAYSH